MTESNATIRTAIVDDDDDIRDLLRMNLQADERFELVGEAVNGTQAVVLITEVKPDVMILDLSMPELDGLEALRRIREVSPEAKVVVFSARYEKYDADDLIGGRADMYVDKSRPMPEVLNEIAALAARSAS